MRFIPTRIHGLIDFATALLLLGSPWFFQFDHGSAETWIPIVMAMCMLGITMFTDHEWAVSRRISMSTHLIIDIVAGMLLIASPWIFGFAPTVYLPHVLMGAGEIVFALFTSKQPTEFSYTGIKHLPHLMLFFLVVASCDRANSASYEVTTMAGQRLTIKPAATLLTTISGFHDPESVLYDPEQDVLFVSNMHGAGSDHDGKGYIVRVAADDYAQSQVFIESGRAGVVLDAPKGMTLRDSVLWVADINVLRGFHRTTGKPMGVIDLRTQGAILLNDVATGPDGSMYATDSAIRMTEKGTIFEPGDRIFSISRDGRVAVVAQGEQLKTPNGIKWNPKSKRWVVVAFDPFESLIYELPEQSSGSPRIIARGPGNFDGVEILDDGSIVATSWKDYSLHLLRNGRQSRIAAGIHQPADLGLDTRRNRLLVPSVILGRVEVWALDNHK